MKRPDAATFRQIYEEDGLRGIMGTYDVSKSTASAWGRKLGLLQRRKRLLHPTYTELERALSEYGTRAKVAVLYGVCGATVGNWMQEVGLAATYTRGCYKRTLQKSIRKCLRCGQQFRSDGPANRICNLCKETNINEGVVHHRVLL